MKKNITILFIILALAVPLWWGITFSKKNLDKFFYAQISQPLQEITLVNIPPKTEKEQPELQVESAISVKINKSGKEKVLLREKAGRAMPIASLTKLMTALIVLENTSENDYDFPKIVTISKTAAFQNNVPIHGNLKEGEHLTIKQLLDLMLIYSSNDSAFALSEVLGEEMFVKKMNSKAKSLGLENTRFINATGLDSENQEQVPNYSTAEELVSLSEYILKKHPLIFEISTKKGPYPITNGISDLYLTDDEKLIGGKTGYTKKAGGCMLVVLENERGNFFINIILGTDSSQDRVLEMQKIINWIAL